MLKLVRTYLTWISPQKWWGFFWCFCVCVFLVCFSFFLTVKNESIYFLQSLNLVFLNFEEQEWAMAPSCRKRILRASYPGSAGTGTLSQKSLCKWVSQILMHFLLLGKWTTSFSTVLLSVKRSADHLSFLYTRTWNRLIFCFIFVVLFCFAFGF